MVTWRRGRELLIERIAGSSLPLRSFIQSLLASPPHRVPGTAVYLTSTPDATPHAFLHSLKHYKVLHEQNVFLNVDFREVPWVMPEERVACEVIGPGCWRVSVRYGFMDRPDIANALEVCSPNGLRVDAMEVSYFLSREKIVRGIEGQGMAPWRDRLFATMARNASTASDYFNIPTNRVVELGTQIEI